MNVFFKIKNKIKKMISWVRLRIYFTKVDFTKMSNKKAQIINIITKIIMITVLLILLVISFIPVLLLNSFNEFVENMSEQIKNQIENLAVTIYGLQLTVYSIMVSTKHKLIFGVSEYKMKMKISKSGHNIGYFIIMSNVYLIFFIISKIFNIKPTVSSIYLLFFSIITLIKNIIMINMNTSKIYYLYRCENLITNPLVRKNGNVKSFMHQEKIIDINPEIILERTQDKNFIKMYDYLLILEEMNFYGLNNNIYDEKELFKIYLNTYFKQINNDSKIITLFLIFNKINDIISTIYRKDNFYMAMNLLELSVIEYNHFIKSKFLKKRFAILRNKEEYCSEKDKNKLVELYVRNLLLLNILIKINSNTINLINEMKMNYENSILLRNITRIEELLNENIYIFQTFMGENKGLII